MSYRPPKLNFIVRCVLSVAFTLLTLQPELAQAECLDPDGDGYGWNGNRACRARKFKPLSEAKDLQIINHNVTDITKNSVRVVANFTEKASVKIKYGKTPAYGQSGPYSGFLKREHYSQVLTKLDPDTTYYYQIEARTRRERVNSSQGQFTTLKEPANTTTTVSTTTTSTTTSSSTSTSSTTTTTQPSLLSGRRDILLADSNRIGYGATATGGTNIVEVKTETEFFDALQVSNSYVLISPSLANTTFTRNTIFTTYANNLTIDGSLAPGFKIKVGSGMPQNSWLFRIFGDNIIIHEIEGEGIDYATRKNQSFLNIYGHNIWIDKVTASGFDDDVVNILLDSDFITVSRLKTFNTNKSVFVFNPKVGQSDTRLTVHSSWMNSDQRGPWISAGQAHSFNNYVVRTGAVAGRTLAQHTASNFQHSDIAELISENNVYANSLYQALSGRNEAAGNEGYVESLNDLGITGGGAGSASGNVTYSSTPTLFNINYDYSSILKPVDDVVSFVQSEAGASTTANLDE